MQRTFITSLLLISFWTFDRPFQYTAMVQKVYVTYNEASYCTFLCAFSPASERDLSLAAPCIDRILQQIHKLCQAAAPRILDEFKPNLMIAIGGIGYVPARILRYMLPFPIGAQNSTSYLLTPLAPEIVLEAPRISQHAHPSHRTLPLRKSVRPKPGGKARHKGHPNTMARPLRSVDGLPYRQEHAHCG